MAPFSTASSLLALVFAAAEVPVAIGNFKTANLPPLTRVERTLPHADMTKQVEGMLASGECKLTGQSKGRFDVVVPYAIRLNGSGIATKVVVQDLGCKSMEMLVAKIVAAQANRGDFKVTPGAADQWFGSDVYFKIGEPSSAQALANPDKVSCKSSPQLGSRIKTNRVCKTAAEWVIYDKDRAQLGRDIRNAGECAGNRSCSQ